MNCQSVRHWLQDAEADEADALFVGEHLETCPDCRALAEAVEAPASVPDSIQPPADLWLGIQTRIDKSIDARQLSAPFGGSRREWQETIGIVMAVAAVVFLALVIRPSLFGAGAGGSVASTGSIMAAAMERECIGAAMELTQQEGAHSLDPQVAALQAQ
ncbi:MAG: hypothetical protein HOH74_19970, partial [Gemmatimonadetes bacterium]|nr:hypothetical protein [Gemmatimonadota bacterium]